MGAENKTEADPFELCSISFKGECKLNMIGSFIRYVFFKSLSKKFAIAILVFIFAYFGLEEMSIVQSAIGSTEYEITKQIEIQVLNTVMGSTRVLKYRLSNVGIRPIGLKVIVNTPNIRPDFELGDVYKIYSNTADQRSVIVTSERPFENRLILNIQELRAGLGIEMIFPDKPNDMDYFGQLDVKLDSSSVPNLFEHGLNRSPISIMLARYSLLFLFCLSISAIIYSVLGVGINALGDLRDAGDIN